jgi:hypothetical protein
MTFRLCHLGIATPACVFWFWQPKTIAVSDNI